MASRKSKSKSQRAEIRELATFLGIGWQKAWQRLTLATGRIGGRRLSTHEVNCPVCSHDLVDWRGTDELDTYTLIGTCHACSALALLCSCGTVLDISQGEAECDGCGVPYSVSFDVQGNDYDYLTRGKFESPTQR